MATIPKGGCKICARVKEIAKSVEKNYKLYAFFAIIIIELVSLFLQYQVSIEQYAYKVYPLLTSLVLGIIFIAISIKSKELKFCTRQKWIVNFLAIYYFMNCFYIISPICFQDYANLISMAIFGIVTTLFVMTWKKDK
jgi:hypothetical protein